MVIIPRNINNRDKNGLPKNAYQKT